MLLTWTLLQVNLCEKLLFLHQLTQNITFIESQVQYMKISSSEHGENILCTEIVFDIQNNICTQHVLPMFYKKRASEKDLPVHQAVKGCVISLYPALT